MHIGKIFEFTNIEIFHADTDIKAAYETVDAGYLIKWSDIFDGQVDVKISGGRYGYIGAIELNASGYSELSLFVDGTKIAPI